jgi:NAD(P)-dependent dehydrogenase (short-subunit alcohol dehydrogenase family)
VRSPASRLTPFKIEVVIVAPGVIATEFGDAAVSRTSKNMAWHPQVILDLVPGAPASRKPARLRVGRQASHVHPRMGW